ncbi:SpoIIE family protein phosphatase [Streptomyces sp. H10-C2]|uniref:SpoIIE family protein phosphatase n=1 Tax=unclassified Streptomyces TaxID=2593676 RepID=UPI0024BBD9BA|nr:MULTISPECIES: SpoIIE family protein phosphatase [unclassified Streptomyces]MDJ0341052.1 SpoIIE family protein phosphatase [Streptomyces sp. PH10-H1]MDJ0369716.1 SpoIIE family protein phosphatase [Streptomyces sp. H10-C2]
MGDAGAVRAEPGASGADPSAAPGGLLDVLGVAAVVLNAEGRIVLWSPQAEDLFGYTAREALGRSAAGLLVDEEHRELVISLFAKVMAGGGTWAGTFPVRHKDRSTRLAEFRNMRLEDEQGRLYALGIASDQATLRRLERDLALSLRLVSQSPIGLAVMDTDLRYVLVNPALEDISGLPAEQHLGRRVSEALPFLDAEGVESAMRHVLATGAPRLNQFRVGRTPADPDTEHAWYVSFYRLEDSAGRVIGIATSVVDVTEQHRAATAAARARRRLALIADASVRIGTTLDLDVTARELADGVVPEFADVVAVDVLDSVLSDPQPHSSSTDGGVRFRALAVKAAYPTVAVQAADPVGELARYDAGRLVTQCVKTGRPVLVAHLSDRDLPRIARDADAAVLLKEAGVHSYLAVPLIARGEVLGALDLKRARNPLPFDHDDVVLAGELAARAAVGIDNARWYQRQRNAALTLQRHLLPHQPSPRPGLEVAYRYQPAAAGEVGGDWFDVIPLSGDRTALVVGDVMGSGINAAATMGQLRIVARTLAGLGLEPDAVLTHLDDITAGLDDTMATCVFAVYDPHHLHCRIATAGHLPPVLTRPGHAPELLDLPTGAPLGVGGVPFETIQLPLRISDELVLYTDGLVETRDQDIDVRLEALTDLLSHPRRPLEETCDLLLGALRHADDHDDVALLIARVQPHPAGAFSHPPT